MTSPDLPFPSRSRNPVGLVALHATQLSSLMPPPSVTRPPSAAAPDSPSVAGIIGSVRVPGPRPPKPCLTRSRLLPGIKLFDDPKLAYYVGRLAQFTLHDRATVSAMLESDDLFRQSSQSLAPKIASMQMNI
jgi:hypothetical protein